MIKRDSRNSDEYFLYGWVAFHAVIFIAFLATFAARRGVALDADLFNMLPRPQMGKAFSVADDTLTEKTGMSVFVMASHEDFDKAKTAAETAYQALKDSTRFKSISLYSDDTMMEDVGTFVQQYKWHLLDEGAATRLTEAGGAEEFAENALAKAYGAFTFSSLDTLESDPFMLGEHILQNYMMSLQNSGTAMSPRDGVLAAQYEGKWYIMMSGILSKAGAALASKTNGVALIYEVCTPLEKDGVRFVYSGTPFHSYKSSNEAVHEVSVISTVTMLAVVLLMLAVFRGPLPIAVSVASIMLSLLTAVAVTFAVFGKIHVLTMVFGTSLIGSCIDYSLHFFVSWRANAALDSGSAVRTHLMRALLMSLLSTELCYLVLAFAPFGLLKQISVFSLCGIASSFLTVAGFYPMLAKPQAAQLPFVPLVQRLCAKDGAVHTKWEVRLEHILERVHLAKVATRLRLLASDGKSAGKVATIAFFAATIGVIAACHDNVRIRNDVHQLYKPKGRVSDDTVLFYKVTKYDPRGWFIIAGDSVEETLQKEERLVSRLEEVNRGKEQGGYVATTQYIPSIARQQYSYETAVNLLPLASYQAKALGLDDAVADGIMADYEADDGKYITPDSPDLPAALRQAVGTTWLGNIDGKYYSIVLPVAITDEAAYDAIADSEEGVYFEYKVRDIGRDLDRLTRMILCFFAIAYVVIVSVIKVFYDWHHTLKIASIPALIVLVITALFAVLGIDLEFFSIVGMILVFGLGLDYVIYMIENEERQNAVSAADENSALEPFAIALSFVTTAVSFGALALSSFVPVHMLGLSIFLGLSTAFLCTIL